MKPRGLSSNPLDRHANALGLASEPAPTPRPAPELAPVADTRGEGGDDIAHDDSDAMIDLESLEDVEVSSAETRRRLPKSRTGTFHNPYPRVDGRDTIKTSFNFGVDERRELDAFFARLGPRRRNLWTEKVLIRAARAATRALNQKEGKG